jgi:DNA primase
MYGGVPGMADNVQEIKERLDIVEVIGDYVRLRKVGKNFRGLCPFHNEKTPSFYVSPERQTFHCFGCGHGGDVFTFIMDVENLEFREALEILAKRAGVELSDGNRIQRGKSLYSVMDLASQFYQRSIHSGRGEMARKYLAKRNITADELSLFEIGWALPSWDALWKYLQAQGISYNDALECGLVLEGRHGAYDRFRGRVMFPVRDIMGKLVAFGGRLVDGDGAKYINSPENSIYSKRKNLYLLHKAKAAIRDRKRSILVEGYMDALRLHLNGYNETVASLGTSLTEEQASLLKRLADKCYICYDSDAAGQDATLRGMYILQSSGLDVYIVELPEGKDPDDLLSAPGGRALFDESISKAKPLVLYHLYSGKKARAEGNSHVTEAFLSSIASLPFERVSPYINHISQELGVLPHIIQERINSLRTLPVKDPDREVGVDMVEPDNAGVEPLDTLQSAVIALLWNDPQTRKDLKPAEVFPLFDDERMLTIAAALLSGEDPIELEKGWLALGDRFPNRVIACGGTYLEQFPESEDLFLLIKNSLERRKRIARYRELKEKLIKKEASSEEFQEYVVLSSELKKEVF